MAKARPFPTLVEMEVQLGYKVDSLTYPNEHLQRFYSDLSPVPRSAYQRTREEFEELERKRHSGDFTTTSDRSLQKIGLVQVSRRPLPKVQADVSTNYHTW